MESANGTDPEAQANDDLEGCLGPETVEQENLSNCLRWQNSVTTVGIHRLAMVAATTHRAESRPTVKYFTRLGVYTFYFLLKMKHRLPSASADSFLGV